MPLIDPFRIGPNRHQVDPFRAGPNWRQAASRSEPWVSGIRMGEPWLRGMLMGGPPAAIPARRESPDAVKRLAQALARGARRGWGNAPLGASPSWIADNRAMARRYPLLWPVAAFNESIAYPVLATGDAALRSANAALHGGAAFAGQAVDEIGLGGGSSLERDLIGMAHVAAGGAGRAQGIMMGSRGSAAQINQAAHRGWHTGKVARQLRRPNPQTTSFGRIDARLLSEINQIRRLEGQPPIGTRDVRIYEAVLRKLQDKRIGLDGLTPSEVARTIYRVIHRPGTVAERGLYPTSHRLVNQAGQGVDIGYVGQGPRGDVSVKTIMSVNRDRLDRIRGVKKKK